jgi:hypothetical protein
LAVREKKTSGASEHQTPENTKNAHVTDQELDLPLDRVQKWLSLGQSRCFFSFQTKLEK